MASDSGSSFSEKYFPALKQRNFRIFWFGQLVSVIGTWMQNIGQDWLVLQLTGSAAKLSIVSAIQFVPIMCLAIFAGPFVDRFPKRRTLILTQSALALLALALALITWTHIVQYWMILVLAFLLGMVQLIDIPTRQAFVIELAGRDALMNAVSLNSAAFNLARIFGPAVAGLLIEAIGIAPCYFLNALSFVAVIVALFAVKVPPDAPKKSFESVRAVLRSTKEGMVYIKDRSEIAVPLILLAMMSTFVINYSVFVPTFAKTSLGRAASGYGFLMTSMGVGSLVAALALAMRSSRGPSRLRLFGGAVVMSAAILVCGLQRDYLISCVLLAIAGFGTISFSASTNATIQLASDNEHRGRVMSVYSLVFGGVTPIGSLWAGAVTELTSPALCMSIAGTIGLVAAGSAILFVRRRQPAISRVTM